MASVKATSSKSVKMIGIVLAMTGVSMVSAGNTIPLVSAQVVLMVLNAPLTMCASLLDQLVLSIQIVQKVMFASIIVVSSYLIQR